MKNTLLLIFLILFGLEMVSAQYVDGTNSKYGNEWIDYDADYYKLLLAEDGIYRLTKNELEASGFPVSTIPMSEMSMFHLGEEVKIYTSSDGLMLDNDYIEFYASKNRNELDKYLYESENWQLNPDYSLVTDTTAYFLTYNVGQQLRYEEQSVDLSGNTLVADDYYMAKLNASFLLRHFKSSQTPDEDSSNFLNRQGLGSRQLKSLRLRFSLKNFVKDKENPVLHARIAGNNHEHEVEFKTSNKSINKVEFELDEIVDETFEFPASYLKNTTDIWLTAIKSDFDRFIVANANLVYPREWNFSEFNTEEWTTKAGAQKRYIEISNFDTQGEIPSLYNKTLDVKIKPIIENDLVKFFVPASSVDQTLVIASTIGLKSISRIEQVSFQEYDSQNYNYLIISNSKLFLDAETNKNWVQEYADYRASVEGGSYNPVIIDVNDLYNQFTYGIPGHFFAIKNFVNYIEPKWQNIEYYFMIGRSYEYSSARITDGLEELNLVPVFGYPGSDHLLTSHWDTDRPNHPIGRLAARNPKEVKVYLDKVKDHEANMKNDQTIVDKQWMKKIMHLSGGGAGEYEAIRKNLASFENIIETNEFGADVTTFYKTNSSQVEVANSERIKFLINNGLSLITFYGHSSGNIQDFSIENVKSYDNKPRYPVMISLGCWSGNVHANNYGITHQFVQEEDKGTIGFLGSAFLSTLQDWKTFGTSFYTNMSKDFYGGTVGEIIYNSLPINDPVFVHHLTYHGDPAVKFHAFPAPDYLPMHETVEIEPKVINLSQESFNVCFDIANIGRNAPGDLEVKIEHLNSSDKILLDTIFTVAQPAYQEKYCLQLPIINDAQVGENRIKIYVDPNNSIEELPELGAESNNELRANNGSDFFSFYILSNTAFPVMPKEYSIVTSDEVTLMANTYNGMSSGESFIVEIDTTSNFNSPIHSKKLLENAVGLLEWKISIPLIPNKVYYWRISPSEVTAGQGYVWNSSSFLYDPNNIEGFNQSELSQFVRNETESLVIEETGFEYGNSFKDFRIENRIVKGNVRPYFFYNNSYHKDLYVWNNNRYLCLTVLDSVGRFLVNPVGGYNGSTNPTNGDVRAHYFPVEDQESRINLVNFLEDVVKEKDYVFFYTKHVNASDNFFTEEWANDSIVNNGKNIFNVLEKQGATKIDYFRDTTIVPYTFIFQKDLKVFSESRAVTIQDSIEDNAIVFGRWIEGTIETPKIGPSSKWASLEWQENPTDMTATDSTVLNLYGYNLNDQKVLLIENIQENSIDLSELVSADTMPYLQLAYYTKDETQQTAVDLDFWRIFYDGTPELTIDTKDGFVFNADTLDRGAPLNLVVPIRNIGAFDVQDSISISLSITNEKNQSVEIPAKIKGIKAGETILFNFTTDTKPYQGTNEIILTVNDDKNPLECFYSNNFGLRSFHLKEDNRNPVMDVTFDGRRILDGDIVSAEPIIVVRLDDENLYYLLDDANAFELYLTSTVVDGGFKIDTISMDDPRVMFSPATSGENNVAEIRFQPTLDDGYYSLTVAGKDIASNESGIQDFVIGFEVINEELVSDVYNYPNPFSTCTQFVFTLTGNELPENFKIQIMTVTGKVVKEIYQQELGPLHIGNNRTNYKWCGEDEFGSKLANGVYLYRVITTKANGDLYEKYETKSHNSVDKDLMFKHDIGKLYIMR